jgi:hypothetical protein
MVRSTHKLAASRAHLLCLTSPRALVMVRVLA